MCLAWSLVAYAVLLAAAAPSVVMAASEEECRTFHQECEEATAAGFRDVGICNVERLECRTAGQSSPTEGAKPMPPPEEPEEAAPDGRPDPERSIGP